MVDFGDTLFDTTLGSSVPSVEPVRDNSTEMFASGLKSGLDGLNAFLSAGAEGKGKAKNNALHQNILEEVSLIADAREQGKLTLTQANSRLRAKTNEWASETDDVDGMFTFLNKVTQDRGIGGSVYTETPQESGERKLIEAGIADGWRLSTPEQINNYKLFKDGSATLQRLQQQAAVMEADGKVMSEAFKQNYVKQFQSVAASAYPWALDKIDTATQAVAATGDPIAKQNIIDALKNEVAVQTGLITSLGGNAGASSTDYLTKPINDLVAQFENTATGKSSQQMLETQIARTKAQQELLMFADPKYGQLFMMNKAMPFTDPEGLAKLDAARLEFWARNGTQVTRSESGQLITQEKAPDVIDKVENVAINFEVEKGMITNALSTTEITSEQTQALNDRIAVTLQSTARNGAAENDATQFSGVVDYLADTSVGQWMEKNWDGISPTTAQAAATVVERQYSDVVLNLVNERWADAGNQLLRGGALGPDGSPMDISKDMTKLIEPTWNGYGIEFRVKDQYKNDPALQGVAKSLNSGKDSVAGPINKLIRMSAHLTGTTDYEKIYNEQFKSRLWITPDKTGIDDNETLDSVSNIPEAALKAPLKRAPQPAGFETVPSSKKGQVGQLLDSIGAAEGANYDTLFGYAEQEGAPFAGTQVTDMSLDEVQALQKLMVRQNGISSAVGKYQFIQDTLRSAIAGLGLKGSEKFTPEVQDKLALWLLQNRTSFGDWIIGNGDAAKFQNELATQWASIPNTSGRSHYADDGVNNASKAGEALVGML